MSRRSDSAWPNCPEPEKLFTAALLQFGPVPGTGWSITRNAAGRVTYVVARGKAARTFQFNVTMFLADDVKKRYSIRSWTGNHCIRVGQMWKNQFNRWLWEQIDASKSGD